jgi:hypothetical protein
MSNISGLNRNKMVKTIPERGCGGPFDFETARLPHFLHNRLKDGGDIVNLTRCPPFTRRKIIFVRRETLTVENSLTQQYI